jgi:hypothetical protein
MPWGIRRIVCTHLTQTAAMNSSHPFPANPQFVNTRKHNGSTLCAVILAVLMAAAGCCRAALITSVVETGGDNEATDTISARYTGQTFPVSIANEPAPGLAIGANFTVPAFGSGVPAFVDRNHRYLDNTGAGLVIPAYLNGLEYIMSGNDNRDNGAYQLQVTVNAPVRCYMLIDNRLGATSGDDPPTFGAGMMQWILDEAWLPTANGLNRFSNPGVPDEVPIDEGANNSIEQHFSVYYKDFPVGTFTLLQADNATRNMYGVVIGTIPGTVIPISNFLAQPPDIPEGGTAQLSWKIDPGATVASIDNGVGNILSLTNANGEGSVNVSPANTTTYTLTVDAPSGNAQSSATVTLQVVESFTAAVAALEPRQPVTLQWNVRAGSSVSISGIGDVTSLTNAQGVGSTTVPHTSSLYTLTAVHNAVSVSAGAAVGFLPPAQRYALLDIGALGGFVEAGAVSGAVIGAGVHNTNGVDLFLTPLVADSGDDFTIAIDNLAPDGFPVGALDWRDRGDGSGVPLTYLAEDFVKNNLGMIRVTLGSLPAGTWDVVSYHIDPGLSQSEQIKILVSDADSGGTAADTGIIASAAWPGNADANSPTLAVLTTEHVARKGTLFSLRSNGTDNVIIYFDSRTAPVDDEVPLAGLVLIPRAVGPPFDITAVSYAPGAVTDTVTLTFTSTPGETYRVRTSPDLVNWTDVNASVPAHATDPTTTFADTQVPKTALRRYYQVARNP